MPVPKIPKPRLRHSVSSPARTIVAPAILQAQEASVFLAPRSFEAEVKTAFEGVDKVIAARPYKADWSSLENYEIPDWYKDAKFGIFIHWGLDVNAPRDSIRLHFAVSDGESTREHFSSGKHTGTGCFDGSDLNQWVHVPVSYDPLNRIVAHYKNGAAVFHNNISRVQKIGVGKCNFGNWSNWPYKEWAKGTEFEIQNLNGAIDQFSAFSRVVPASEIRASYAAGLPGK